jgi:hypothetical protein
MVSRRALELLAGVPDHSADADRRISPAVAAIVGAMPGLGR